MRRYIVLVVLLLAFGGISASAAGPCTIRGTNGNDVLNGTSHSDFICARQGNDYANGRGAGDVVRGGAGNDTVVGGSGQDTLRGRRGNDKLFGIDGHPLDFLAGGPGNDQCYVDLGDRITGCESVRVSKPLLGLKLTMVELTPALQQWLDNHEDEGR